MNYNYADGIIENSYGVASEIKKISMDLDLYRLSALKNVLSNFLNSDTTWNYYVSNEKIFYSRIIVNDIEKIRWFAYPKIIENKISDFCVHVCLNCKTFDVMSVQTFFKEKNMYNESIDEVNIINDFFYDSIQRLYNIIKSSFLVENYFFESYQLKIGNIYGYYNFDRLEIDCGDKTNHYNAPRIIKCKIKYYKVIINELSNKMLVNETLMIDRKIIMTLLQTFTRCAFNNKITNGRYFGKNNDSFYKFNRKESINSFIKLDRNKIITQFYEEIPDDTNFLINKFYYMNYDKQNVFLSACSSYIEGLKEKNAKSLTSFVISLESLANYNYKKLRISKKKRIYKLIKELFKETSITQEYIDYVYDLRCLYSHEGIDNNQLKNMIFEIDNVDKNIILNVESLAYSVLIKWLIEE